jgi:hypothetical protein
LSCLPVQVLPAPPVLLALLVLRGPPALLVLPEQMLSLMLPPSLLEHL